MTNIADTKERVPVDLSIIDEWQRSKPWAHLQAWFMQNYPDDKMIWKEAASTQVVFFRDIFFEMFPDQVEVVEVISTHRSKSIDLPVYHVKLKNGIDLIFRDNFHGIRISVESPFDIHLHSEITAQLLFGNSIEEQVHECYCEGFKREWIYGPYKLDKKKFTAEIYSTKYFHTFVFLLRSQTMKLNEDKK